MLCKEDGDGPDATTMVCPLKAKARACYPCGITRLACLVQLYLHAGFDKMCTRITAFEFFVHHQRALASIPSCQCLRRICNCAEVGQKAGSSGVGKNLIQTPWMLGFL